MFQNFRDKEKLFVYLNNVFIVIIYIITISEKQGTDPKTLD